MANRKGKVMGELTQKQVDSFLKELTELSQKHRIQVSGCGCCGSPYLMPLEEIDLPNQGYETASRGLFVDSDVKSGDLMWCILSKDQETAKPEPTPLQEAIEKAVGEFINRNKKQP